MLADDLAAAATTSGASLSGGVHDWSDTPSWGLQPLRPAVTSGVSAE